MILHINGYKRKFKDTNSLEEIIQKLKIENKVMAAAVNMEVVKKDLWNTFIPKENDKIELLHFVGGGWFLWVGKKEILLKK